MKGLNNLIRLHKLKLTEQQKKLNDLQAVSQGFLTEITAIDRSAREEAENAEAHTETVYALGGYIQASIMRRETLQTSLRELEREMGVIKDEVAAAFRELKRYELIAERRETESARKRQKRERRDEDEIAMGMHRQKGQIDSR